MVKIKLTDLASLPRWEPWQVNGHWGVRNHDTGTLLATGLTEAGATLMAGAPRMLAFLALFTVNRVNAPISLDLANLLNRIGIELEP